MLTIGSRGSALALWQARWAASRLEALGETARIEVIHTTGDRVLDVTLAKVGTKGMFTKEIEEALLGGSIDIAVHSLKDMPADLPTGLTLAAVPEREDARDCVVGRPLASLAAGSRVGTSSLRRAAQLRALRPDLEILDIRGNVDTRLRKLDEGRYEAILLAAAGLHRLGLRGRIAEYLEPERMCPAVGQGALAIETRAGGGRARQLAVSLDHPATRAAVTAERALLAALGGGCQVPAGAYAYLESGVLRLRAIAASPDGLRVIRASVSGDPAQAEALGRQAGDELLAQGAREILETVYGGR